MKEQNVYKYRKNKITKTTQCILGLWKASLEPYGIWKIKWILFYWKNK